MRRPFDDAERMVLAHRMLGVSLLLALAGCGKTPIVPAKSVTVPAGEKPVLTSLERRDRPALLPVPDSAIAPASFEMPVAEPLPIKPLAAWTEQEAAAEALGRIGAAAVPELIQTLQSPDATVRLKGVEVLGRMGADAKDAVPQLVRLLDDPDLDVRKAAARTLGRIGPGAHEAVPALMKSLLQPALLPSPHPEP